MKTLRVLLVDDDPEIHDFIAVALEQEHVEIVGVGSAEAALARVNGNAPDLILLDLVLPGMDGCTALRELKERGVAAPIVVITSHGSMDAAIQAVEAGAVDVLTKPLRVSVLIDLIVRLRSADQPETAGKLESPHARGPVDDVVLIGKSPQMMEVYKAIGRVARTDATVLIQGESGTGKELVAQAIHRYSKRTGSFVAMNCAAVPETLLETELFGHEKGAFTGAATSKPGKLERATNGTFLLDEVGDMPLSLQSKILRVLDKRRIERLGGNRSIDLDVRMVSATHHDLQARVQRDEFREDLYYRLAVVTINLPPLRDREGDIRLLVDHYLARLAPRVGRAFASVHPEVYDLLETYPWPGNVRELRNVLEQSMILGRTPVLEPSALPDFEVPFEPDSLFDRLAVEQRRLDEVERGYIERVLHLSGWNQSEAARRLGIHRNTLRRKIRGYSLRPDHVRRDPAPIGRAG